MKDIEKGSIILSVTFDEKSIEKDIEFKKVPYLIDWINYNIGFISIRGLATNYGTWDSVDDFLAEIGWYAS